MLGIKLSSSCFVVRRVLCGICMSHHAEGSRLDREAVAGQRRESPSVEKMGDGDLLASY